MPGGGASALAALDLLQRALTLLLLVVERVDVKVALVPVLPVQVPQRLNSPD